MPFHHSPPQGQMGNCTVKGTMVDCTIHGTSLNCSLRRAGREGRRVVRIIVDSCRVVEYEGPVRVGDVIHKFPRHEIFRQGNASSPLLRHELLLNGQLYYLLPLAACRGVAYDEAREVKPGVVCVSPSHRDYVKPRSSPGTNLDIFRNLEVLPSPIKGVWRVKLAITAELLAEILSQQVDTEALIETMRMFACSVKVAPLKVKQEAARCTPAHADQIMSKVRPNEHMFPSLETIA